MNEQVREYIENYPKEIIDMYIDLRKLIFDSASTEPQETMWAKMPSYYIGETFVRLIPFKDHINIEAKAVLEYKEELSEYKITPKGMLQIFVNQAIPVEVLKRIFAKTLNKMMLAGNELLDNLDRLHTTELGVVRIKRNLSLATDDVVEWCRERISSDNAVITRNGKNWYVHIDACKITVNAYSYTIITAHKENSKEERI